jgi:hypothetical protein
MTTELETAVLAKNGDKAAIETLWVKYRKPMSNVFWGLPMTPEERESEAADVFMHYIKNLFDLEKKENQRENWTFFSYLYSGMVGRRSKLRRRRVHLSYDESAEFEEESGPGALNAETVCFFNRDLFMRYDPEEAVISEPVQEKVKQLYADMDCLKKIKQDCFNSIRGRMALVNQSEWRKEDEKD